MLTSCLFRRCESEACLEMGSEQQNLMPDHSGKPQGPAFVILLTETNGKVYCLGAKATLRFKKSVTNIYALGRRKIALVYFEQARIDENVYIQREQQRYENDMMTPSLSNESRKACL